MRNINSRLSTLSSMKGWTNVGTLLLVMYIGMDKMEVTWTICLFEFELIVRHRHALEPNVRWHFTFTNPHWAILWRQEQGPRVPAVGIIWADYTPHWLFCSSCKNNRLFFFLIWYSYFFSRTFYEIDQPNWPRPSFIITIVHLRMICLTRRLYFF